MIGLRRPLTTYLPLWEKLPGSYSRILAKAGALNVRRPLAVAGSQAMTSYFDKLFDNRLNSKRRAK